MENARIKVLVVDDEREFIQSVQPALHRRGFEVTAAVSADQARALLEVARFDVALLDVCMPGMPGDELFRFIHHRWPTLPVVLLTGHGSLKQAFTTSREGVYEYLTKPCTVDHLTAVLRRAASERDTALAQEEMPATGILDGTRLLLVDDEREFVSSLTAVLERRGVKVSPTHSGAEALEIMATQIFDVALIDLKMPGMNGDELLAVIKRRHPGTEVILLTGHPTIDSVRRVMKVGAFDYLTKPCALAALLEKVGAACSRARERASRQRRDQVQDILDNRTS